MELSAVAALKINEFVFVGLADRKEKATNINKYNFL